MVPQPPSESSHEKCTKNLTKNKQAIHMFQAISLQRYKTCFVDVFGERLRGHFKWDGHKGVREKRCVCKFKNTVLNRG